MTKRSALALVAAAFLAAPSATAAPRGSTPTCAAMPGRTLAQSGTWRVLLPLGTKWGRDDLLACRRIAGPAKVVVRIRASTPYLHGVQLSGGLMLRTQGDQNGKYNPARVSHDLIDLDGARRALTPAFPVSELYSATGKLQLLMLGGGALLSWNEGALRAAPGTRLLDAAGERPVADGQPPNLAVVRGPSGPAATAYVLTSTFDPVRVQAGGAPVTTWADDGTARRAANPVRVARRPAVSRATLATFGPDVFVDVARRRQRGVLKAWVEVSGHRVASIMPGTTATPLAAAGFVVAVDAVWADTGTRSTRVYDRNSGNRRALVDLPTPAAGWQPGALAVSPRGALAVSDGTRLRIWDPVERVVDEPGLTDLAVGQYASGGQATLFATDAQGRARIWTLAGPS